LAALRSALPAIGSKEMNRSEPQFLLLTKAHEKRYSGLSKEQKALFSSNDIYGRSSS
jgi:hypothetical protein